MKFNRQKHDLDWKTILRASVKLEIEKKLEPGMDCVYIFFSKILQIVTKFWHVQHFLTH